MVPSSPTNFYTSCPRIDSPTIVDRRVEVVYSPASVKFCPPRKRLFQREGHCGGETMLDQLSPSACSPSWIDDGKRDRNIPRYSPPSAMPASPPSTRAYHPSSNSQQDDRFYRLREDITEFEGTRRRRRLLSFRPCRNPRRCRRHHVRR
mmetsp:Transcript_14094/g.13897  ORF Transcript_14094/g.13897 Transcript_14094/m.13897 type:complete len:149 (+) Transcript_14094:3-449(+)